jgi:hypothetical protein
MRVDDYRKIDEFDGSMGRPLAREVVSHLILRDLPLPERCFLSGSGEKEYFALLCCWKSFNSAYLGLEIYGPQTIIVCSPSILGDWNWHYEHGEVPGLVVKHVGALQEELLKIISSDV